MHKVGGPVLHQYSTCKNVLECINCVVIRGVARSLSAGEWGGCIEATDNRQNEHPITDKYINANVQMSTNLTLYTRGQELS